MSLNGYAFFVTKGLEDVCLDEIEATLNATRFEAVVRPKLVLTTAQVTSKAIRKLRTVDDAGEVLAEPGQVNDQRQLSEYIAASLTKENLEAAALRTRGFDDQFSVTVTAARSPAGNASQLQQILEEHITSLMKWQPLVRERASLDLRLFADQSWVMLSRRMFEEPLSNRSYRLHATPGALRPTVAAAMVRLTGSHAGGYRVWDPFCGSGTILAEAALKNNEVAGTDISAEAIAVARENLGAVRRELWSSVSVGDSTNNAVWKRHEKCNVIITNIPWGKQVDIKSARALYESLAAGCAELTLKRRGVAAILTTDPERLKAALRRVTSEIQVVEKKIGLLGQTPTIVTIQAR
ncbi:methyltransferase [Pseudofrankia sp. DC12]|uniref:TRM11 family SAM-dependent methyltransferase n=1 Tax=Pseudofrankia sp. DC12 TaxID=683315 RepID=UPI0009FBAE41|nr:methyltransferase [Pseudofrankia sp. DC12]